MTVTLQSLQNPTQAMANAVFFSNEEWVSKLCASYQWEIPDDGPSVLLLAAKRGKVTIFLSLLKAIDYTDRHYLDFQDRTGRTALVWSIILGHDEIASECIDRGANLELADSQELTPLMWACGKGNVWVAQKLINKGVPPDELSYPSGITPLMIACKLGKLDMLSFLLNQRKSPIHYQSDIGKNYLSGKVYINRQSRNGFTALMFAVFGNSERCVEELLSRGADPGMVNKSGQTALSLAIGLRLPKIVSPLLAFMIENKLCIQGCDMAFLNLCLEIEKKRKKNEPAEKEMETATVIRQIVPLHFLNTEEVRQKIEEVNCLNFLDLPN